LTCVRLPRRHRAVPSASLDKSGYFVVSGGLYHNGSSGVKGNKGFSLGNRSALQIDLLEEGVMSPEPYEECKQKIAAVCQNAKNSGLVFEASFEIKPRIIHTMAD
jgi:hypothetical protein